MMGNTLKSRSSTTKLRGRRMFKREFRSSKHMQMKVLTAVASKEYSVGKRKLKSNLAVATEEFICVILYYLHFHFTSNHTTSVLLFLPSLLKVCVFYPEFVLQNRPLSTI